MSKIRIGLLGYGNLSRGIQYAVKQNEDMELTAVFTRRDPKSLVTVQPVTVESVEKLNDYLDKIDVMILCGGSATDLPVQGPEMLAKFNTVDSFDTHARIPEYFSAMDAAGKKSGKLGAVSIGWDPGLFSMARMLFNAFAPEGQDYTFWGRGVSQGHSDAIRRVSGVKNAVQYTVPSAAAVEAVRRGEDPVLSTRDKHTRECYVVAEEGADRARIEREIVSMPNYFADYDTTVHFITEEELKRDHGKMPHGGFVFRSAQSANANKFLLELSIKLDSNPEFTSSVLVSFARAIYRMHREGKTGAVTALDVPLSYLSASPHAELLQKLV